jgi:hypothetical protein
VRPENRSAVTPLARRNSRAARPVTTPAGDRAFDRLYALATQGAQPDDPAADSPMPKVMPLRELILVTIVVVALLIAAFMLYPA